MILHKVCRIMVRCGSLVLNQTHQVIKATGQRRERNFLMSETIEIGEYPIEAAVQGLRKELGLSIPSERLKFMGYSEEVKPSPSTGEVKRYQFWDYEIFVSPEEAEIIPLEVDEGEVITYFAWK